MDIKKVFDSRCGVVFISIILGVGIAALFRTVCKDGKCIVVTGPPMDETKNFYYKIDQNCFKYTPVASECPN
jgi:hypothetical protein